VIAGPVVGLVLPPLFLSDEGLLDWARVPVEGPPLLSGLATVPLPLWNCNRLKQAQSPVRAQGPQET